jgi:hypothetical protein
MRISACVLFIVALLADGCSAPLTREKFDRVRVGSDDCESVQKLLGPPKSTFGDTDEWLYEIDDATALVQFGRSGRVAAKQWFDDAQHPEAKPAGTAESHAEERQWRRVFGLD